MCIHSLPNIEKQRNLIVKGKVDYWIIRITAIRPVVKPKTGAFERKGSIASGAVGLVGSLTNVPWVAEVDLTCCR